ncbi:hypothetical protein K469DRAFT_463649, partial [Zopfia rhizophila CBS 207.26]
LITLITVRNLPFRMIEWPEFHAFYQVLNLEVAGYIIIAYSTINKIVLDSFTAQKD